MIIKEILRDAKSQLAESGISEVDAEHLLAYVLGLSRMDLHNPVMTESTSMFKYLNPAVPVKYCNGSKFRRRSNKS